MSYNAQLQSIHMFLLPTNYIFVYSTEMETDGVSDNQTDIHHQTDLHQSFTDSQDEGLKVNNIIYS